MPSRPLSRVLLPTAILSTAALLLTGCAASAAPDEGGATFVYAGNTTFISDWDPASYYGNEDVVLDNVYETLTVNNAETNEIDPLLATSWESSDDQLTWTFQLRDDVTFHTGRAFDSTAVKESIERTKELGLAASYEWDAVTSIDTPSPTEVVFHLSKPVPLAVHAASGFSAHIYDVKATDGDLVDWFNQGNDAGTGPYTVADFQKGADTEVKLSAYDDYWGGWKPDQYQRVEYKVVPSETTAWQLLQQGEVDFIKQVSSQLFDEVEASGKALAISSPSFQNTILALNTETGPLSDIRVRKAILKSIDAQELASVLNGAVNPASGLIPEGLPGYTPGLELVKDLDGAKALLEEAGYGPAGEQLTLHLAASASNTTDEQFATLLSSTLSELNVTLDAQYYDGPAKIAAVRNEDKSARPDLSLRNWWPIYPDSSSWFIDLVHSAEPTRANYSYLKNDVIDAQIDTIENLSATDPAALQSLYETLNRQVVEDEAATTGVVVQNSQRVLADGITGYVDNLPYANVVFVYQLTSGAQ